MKIQTCLGCGKLGRLIRRNCPACYRKLLYAILAGDATWDDLVTAGKAAEVQPRSGWRLGAARASRRSQ